MTSISLSELDEHLFTKIFETTFPIGTIFQTTIIGNPNTIIPGATNSEWEQITDRMLIGAGNTYPIESTGGEATVTLTKDQLPSHTHTRGSMNIIGEFGIQGCDQFANVTSGAFYTVSTGHVDAGTSAGAQYINKAGFDASRSWTGETSSVGGNQSHNNIPPYYAVYIWKRVA